MLNKFQKNYPNLFSFLGLSALFAIGILTALIGVFFESRRVAEILCLVVLLSIPAVSYLRHKILWGISFRDWYMKYW